MGRLTALRTIASRIAVAVLIAVLCIAQVALSVAATGAPCASGAWSSSGGSAAAQPHRCCCGGTGPCRCDARQGPAAASPAAALVAVSAAERDLAALYVVPDTGAQILYRTQVLQSAGGRGDIDPPIISPYLANLTIRC
jgi:hypothetical protein